MARSAEGKGDRASTPFHPHYLGQAARAASCPIELVT
jgi:hypothetical protein